MLRAGMPSWSRESLGDDLVAAAQLFASLVQFFGQFPGKAGQHVRHALKLVGDHRAYPGHLAGKALPHPEFLVAGVDALHQLAFAAAAGGKWVAQHLLGDLAFLAQGVSQVVEDAHAVGVFLLPAASR